MLDILRCAVEEYTRGNYAAARGFYQQLAAQIGEKNFRANIQLCQKRLRGTPLSVDRLHTPPNQVKVACVMDEFTYQCFAPECDLRQITPQNWCFELEKFKPDLFFIESAWRGLNDVWSSKISPASSEILSAIGWCIEHQVPTIFWNKEDPFSFEKFLPIARMVDYVFTTDLNSIGDYRRELRHDRVYVLPFAAQPRFHNPIEIFERKDAANFAGSYYWKYEHRIRDFDTILSGVMPVKPVTIYDRNADRPKPHDFEFPEHYRPYVIGSLPYSEIEKAYKGYQYAINMSTSKESVTMFARRVFELAASNTITISNYSAGIRLFFGDLVICSDNVSQIKKQLSILAADDKQYRKQRLWALRKVLDEHTYQHRFSFILSKVDKNLLRSSPCSVCVLGQYFNSMELVALCAAWSRQNQSAALILIGPSMPEMALPKGVMHYSAIDNEAMRQLLFYTHVAVFSPADHYGMHYLQDLVLATRFSNAAVLGKAAYYSAVQDDLVLHDNGAQYSIVILMHWRHVQPLHKLRQRA